MAQFNAHRYAWVPLLGLVTLSALGCLLRLQMVAPLPINYRYFVHAHSHTAFMGWVYNALFLLLAALFFKPQERSLIFRRYFLWLQVGVVGMLVSFPLQGYGPAAIAFSTLHMAVTVAVAVTMLRHLRSQQQLSHRLLRWALAFQLLSGVGPLLLGPLAALGYKDSQAYQLAIYFFMHFQFNGWFVLGGLALLFRWLEAQGFDLRQWRKQWLVMLLAWTVVPAYAMSALWMEAGLWLQVVAMATGLLQVAGLVLLSATLAPARSLLLANAWAGRCLKVWWLALALKYLLQLLGSVRPIDTWVTAHHGLIIGFIHLVFIGVATFLLLGFYLLLGWLRITLVTKTGVAVFFTGFVVTELLLFGAPVLVLAGGTPGISYFKGLLIAAAALWAGSMVILAGSSSRPGIAANKLEEKFYS